jgi:hypothetical protein
MQACQGGEQRLARLRGVRMEVAGCSEGLHVGHSWLLSRSAWRPSSPRLFGLETVSRMMRPPCARAVEDGGCVAMPRKHAEHAVSEQRPVSGSIRSKPWSARLRAAASCRGREYESLSSLTLASSPALLPNHPRAPGCERAQQLLRRCRNSPFPCSRMRSCCTACTTWRCSWTFLS